LQEASGLSRAQVDEVFYEADENKDGKIDQREFNGPKGYEYQKQKFESREEEASQTEGKKALNKYDSD